MLEGMGVPDRWEQRDKNWDNCNSMINKMYFKKWKGVHQKKKKKSQPYIIVLGNV